jgi:hypothetical protein
MEKYYSEVTSHNRGDWRYVEFVVYSWNGRRYRPIYREDRMLMLPSHGLMKPIEMHTHIGTADDE